MVVNCDRVECTFNSECKCTADEITLTHCAFDSLSCETFPYTSKLKKCPNCGARVDGATEYVSTYSLGKIPVPNGAIKQIIEDGKEQDNAVD